MARFARLFVVAAALAALTACSGSRSQAPPPAVGAWNAQPPAAQGMDPRLAHGLWKTTFGAVKIEDESSGRLHGVWTYPRGAEQVVGYFAGTLDGNVLRLTWREPAQPAPGAPQLGGEGWIVFEPTGARFTGRWWTSTRDRQGDWNGWRGPAAGASTEAAGFGGAGDGGASPTYPPPPPPTRY